MKKYITILAAILLVSATSYGQQPGSYFTETLVNAANTTGVPDTVKNTTALTLGMKNPSSLPKGELGSVAIMLKATLVSGADTGYVILQRSLTGVSGSWKSIAGDTINLTKNASDLYYFERITYGETPYWQLVIKQTSTAQQVVSATLNYSPNKYYIKQQQ